MPPPTHLEGYAPVLGAIQAEGGDPHRFLRGLGVEPEAPIGSDGAEPEAVARDLLEAAMAAFGDGFAVRCAPRVLVEAFGVLGYVCLTTPDLGAALERGLRYRRLLFSREDYALETDVDPCRLVRRAVDDVGGRFARAARGLVELGLAEHVGAMREVLGEDVAPLEVRFVHAGPADTREHQRFFRAPLRFSCARDELVFPRGWLVRPTRHGHPSLASYFEEQARALLARVPEDDSMGGVCARCWARGSRTECHRSPPWRDDGG